VWHNRNDVSCQELLNCHNRVTGCVIKLRHSAQTLRHVCTQWPVENGIALCARFPPDTHAQEGRLWLAAQSHGRTSTLAHHSGNFLNALHKLLVYSEYINLFSKNINTTKKKTDPPLVPSKDVGLEVNAEKIKYMLMSRHHHDGQIRNIKHQISLLKMW
jgi:hypothetical protein